MVSDPVQDIIDIPGAVLGRLASPLGKKLVNLLERTGEGLVLLRVPHPVQDCVDVLRLLVRAATVGHGEVGDLLEALGGIILHEVNAFVAQPGHDVVDIPGAVLWRLTGFLR